MEFLNQGKNHRHRPRSRRGPFARTLLPGRAPGGFLSAQSPGHLAPAADTVNTESDDSFGPPLTKVPCRNLQEPLGDSSEILDNYPARAITAHQGFPSSPPTTLSNMHTFGTMARAAEYAAAKAANARQVSREVEAQKLPPKSTPVSLGAFTKGQSSNRNKGNKAWKPLTADDLGGEEDYSENPTFREQTRFYSDNDEEPLNIRRPLARPDEAGIEQFHIPTAPRAMLVQRDRPAVLVSPALHTSLGFPPPQSQQASEGTAGRDMQGRSLLHVPQLPHHPSRRLRAAYSHEMQFVGAYSHQVGPTPLPPWNGPEVHPSPYLMPARGEIADVLRERQHQQMLNMGNLQPDMTQQHPPMFGPFDNSPVNYYNGAGFDASGYGPMQPPSFNTVSPPYYPAQQAIARDKVPQTILATPSGRRLPRSNFDEPPAPYPPAYRKPDFPYDRALIMETYKASLTKEALERKGKTVLHNPDLYKQQEQQSPGFVDTRRNPGQQNNTGDDQWQDLDQLVLQSKEGGENIDMLQTRRERYENQRVLNEFHGAGLHTESLTGNNAVERYSQRAPPPGLEIPTDGNGDNKGNGLKEFPDDFYTLKPLSSIELKRVRELSQKARDEIADTVKQPLHGVRKGEPVNAALHKEHEDWFYGLPHDKDIPQQHALAATIYNRAIKDNSIEKKDEGEMAAEQAIIGNVIETVKDILEQCKMPEEKRTRLFKIEPVPYSALERPSVQTGGTAIFSSFFEEPATKGEAEKHSIPTPRRIARDPRFRRTPEGGQGNFEEVRVARHENYGRRGL